MTLYDITCCLGLKKHAVATGKPLPVTPPRTGLTEQLVTVAEELNFLFPACGVQANPSSSVITTLCKKDQPQTEYQVAGVAFPFDLQGASALLLHSARRKILVAPPEAPVEVPSGNDSPPLRTIWQQKHLQQEMEGSDSLECILSPNNTRRE